MSDLIYCYGCKRWHRSIAFGVTPKKEAGRKCLFWPSVLLSGAAELERLEQRAAEADAKWQGAPERMRQLVNHFLAGGAKPRPGMGMVIL